jgi:hypothetical protein
VQVVEGALTLRMGWNAMTCALRGEVDRVSTMPGQSDPNNPARRFATPDEADLGAMMHQLAEMRETLEQLHLGAIPSATFSPKELKSYCRSLVVGQHRGDEFLKPGSWPLSMQYEDMPADARVEFVFLPTYIAVATLSKYLLVAPGEAIQIRGYGSALRKGLLFATYRSLQGSGFDGPFGFVDAVGILSFGEVPRLLLNSPTLCPELLDLLLASLRETQSNIEAGATRSAWGIDLRREMEGVVATLALLGDPPLLGDIDVGRSETVEQRSRPLQW